MNYNDTSIYYGNRLKIQIFGSSHSEEIGVKIDGLKNGEQIDIKKLQSFLDRRKANASVYSTPRKEEDEIIFNSGINNDILNGQTLIAVIKNKVQNSKDYGERVILPRPSHADYVASVKYGDKFDHRGGGKFSGRLTAPMCVAGGICKQLLEEKGIKINAFLSRIGKVKLKDYNDIKVEDCDFNFKNDNFRLLDYSEQEKVDQVIINAKADGDSVGGTIDCVITGVPVGIGEYMFDSLESIISHLAFAVPAVKGIEFGSGFELAEMNGSIANDEFYYDDDKVKTYTNNNGGINGGIANGMPITFRVAIKPTPSIAKEQKTINLQCQKNDVLSIRGRHDACIVPRAVAVIEAISAIAIFDSMNK